MVLDEAKFKALQSSQLLVVGDSMLDRYWLGEVRRISPEAPVPIINVESIEQRLGGAANVAMNIVSVGGQATLLSLVGEDEAGSAIEAMLMEAQIEMLLPKSKQVSTTIKLRMVSKNQQLLRADFESKPSKQALKQSLEAFQSAIKQASTVLISDYGKGGADNTLSMIQSAKAHDVPVYIDPKGKDYALYQGASLITPNLSEFQQVVGEVYELDEIDVAAQKLMSDFDIAACLITLSERGMLLCQQGEKSIHQATRAREVYDVTGAGDTVIAMMALARAAHFSFEEAVVLANHAAGVVVNKMGTATASLDEIKFSMRRDA